MDQRSEENVSAWAPLGNPVYRSFWLASLVSNLGTWMHEVGSGWLMTELDASPQMVSSVRTAMAAPIVFLAIPAGVLADRVDRRRLLLGTQSLMLVTTGFMALMTLTGAITSWSLLSMTFLMGIGLTLHAPTWQASIPELVPRAQLSRAIALGSISFNLARAVGPALAGVLVAMTGCWIAFSINAFSFAGVILVLAFWKRERRESSRGLSFGISLYQGLRFVGRTASIRNVLIRLAMFVMPASVFWCLLPLVARERLSWGAGGFGILVTCVGAGAVFAARFLPGWHARCGVNWTATHAGTLVASALCVLSVSTDRYVVTGATLAFGCGWMMTLTTFNTCAQIILPSRLKARGMGCYLTAFAIAMSGGSAVWGWTADAIGISGAQQIAAAMLLIASVAGLGLRMDKP
ncbi:MAG: MFS transporter [Planctomycetota bacterium]